MKQKWASLLDSQKVDVNSAIDWKLTIVGLMIWTVSQMPNNMQNEQHRKDNRSKDTWTRVREDLNQII